MISNKKLWRPLLAVFGLAVLSLLLIWRHHQSTGQEGGGVSQNRDGSGLDTPSPVRGTPPPNPTNRSDPFKRKKDEPVKFGNEQVVDNVSAKPVEEPKESAAASESPTTSVDIIEKPQPQYTAEGRSLKIEGDVVIDMVFLANGTVQVNRVISGLGHGLDEAAMRAAQQIKFEPAKRDGQPVDFPARVRVEFRLAH